MSEEKKKPTRRTAKTEKPIAPSKAPELVKKTDQKANPSDYVKTIEHLNKQLYKLNQGVNVKGDYLLISGKWSKI